MSTIPNLLKRIEELSINDPICFCLNPTSDDEKLSAHFYDPRTLKLIKNLEKCNQITTVGSISQKVCYSDGKWDLRYSDYVHEDYPNCVLLLQISNLKNDGTLNIETGREKFISREFHEKWKNSQVKSDDIIIAITGTIGRSSLVPNGFQDANLNQALAMIVLKKSEAVNGKKINIDKKYVLYYLNSELAQTQLRRYGGFRSNQDGLSTTEIKNTLIPLPLEKKQTTIVKLVENHLNNSANSQSKLQKATRQFLFLLEDVLEEKLPELKNEVFTFDLNSSSSRLDYGANSLDLEKTMSYLEKAVNNKKIELKNGKKLLSDDRNMRKKEVEKNKARFYKYVDFANVDNQLGSINASEEDILMNLPTRARQVMKKHDILIPGGIDSLNSITIVPPEYDGHLCSTGFLVIGNNNTFEEALILFGIFKSRILQRQFWFLQSGCILESLAPKTFQEMVKVPILNDQLKKKLLKLVKTKLEEAKKLKINHLMELKRAKDVFDTEVRKLL